VADRAAGRNQVPQQSLDVPPTGASEPTRRRRTGCRPWRRGFERLGPRPAAARRWRPGDGRAPPARVHAAGLIGSQTRWPDRRTRRRPAHPRLSPPHGRAPQTAPGHARAPVPSGEAAAPWAHPPSAHRPARSPGRAHPRSLEETTPLRRRAESGPPRCHRPSRRQWMERSARAPPVA
jgi:hypothetical protein